MKYLKTFESKDITTTIIYDCFRDLEDSGFLVSVVPYFKRIYITLKYRSLFKFGPVKSVKGYVCYKI